MKTKRLNLKLSLLLCAVLLGNSAAQAATWYVNINRVTSGDGASWSDAFRELQEAFEVAINGDVILVAEGVYRPDFDTASQTHTGARLMSFVLPNGVTVRGGFQVCGPACVDFDPTRYLTILSGDLQGDDGPTRELLEACLAQPDLAVIPGCEAVDRNNDDQLDANDEVIWQSQRSDNSYHVLTCPPNGGAEATLEGFIIANGNADGNEGDGVTDNDRGGGLWCRNRSPIIRQCVFRDNRAANAGGALTTVNGSPVTDRCAFLRNATTSHIGRGGAVCLGGSGNTLVESSRFERNQAHSGGAICVTGANAQIIGCLFSGNEATRGGAAANSDNAQTQYRFCTFTGNLADGQYGGGALLNLLSVAAIDHCIFWGDGAERGAELYLAGGQMSVARSVVQGGRGDVYVDSLRFGRLIWGQFNGEETFDDNLTADPRLTPDGHLSAESPCIDLGIDLRPSPTDIDGEQPLSGPQPDIGADEWLDTDGDLLADWWEQTYSPYVQPLQMQPDGDEDLDGIENIKEYAQTGTQPTQEPIYVGPDGLCDPLFADGSLFAPFCTIQEGLAQAPEGGTLILLSDFPETTYQGPGNLPLNLLAKNVVVSGCQGLDCFSQPEVILDGQGVSSLLNNVSAANNVATLARLTLRNGFAEQGGALNLSKTRIRLENITFQFNDTAEEGSAIFAYLSSPTLSDINIDGTNAFPAVVMRGSSASIESNFALFGNGMQLEDATLAGTGSLHLDNAAQVLLPETPQRSSSNLLIPVNGPGLFDIGRHQQLVLDDQAVLNLSDGGTLGCNADPGPTVSPAGAILSEGSLLLRGTTEIHNAVMMLQRLRLDGSNTLTHNEIYLQEGRGEDRELFVGPSASISCNLIISEGDRYIDLAPDPNAAPPALSENPLTVLISAATQSAAETLLELRAEDFDCNAPLNIDCPSGAYQTSLASAGFTADPSANWVIDRLEVLPGAQINLTNDEGFDFHPGIDVADTAYVKELVLHPQATFNTGLQALYYNQLKLVDPNGVETEFTDANMPPYPERFENGARIVDEPLLGYSLNIIRLDDDFEYDVRVDQRTASDEDTQPCTCGDLCDDGTPGDNTTCKQGDVKRYPFHPLNPPGDGLMRMATARANRTSAASVSAKGTFARSVADNVLVAFEYLFRSDPNRPADPNMELVVYLSEDPDLGEGLYEVARIRPPQSGRSGAVGSSTFGLYSEQIPRNTLSYALDFERGTYVELELRGKNAICLIDNWDPAVTCTYTCGDTDGSHYVTDADFLLVLAESHESSAAQNLPCLDLSNDGYVDLTDIVMWDPDLLNGYLACGAGAATSASLSSNDSVSLTGGTTQADPGLYLSGKPRSGGALREDLLASAKPSDILGTFATLPVTGNTYYGGRIAQDPNAVLYQVNAYEGLYQVNDPTTTSDDDLVLAPDKQTDPDDSGNDVLVGAYETAFLVDEDARAIVSVAFDPNATSNETAFIAPVIVRDKTGSPDPYQAAAKVELTGSGGFTLKQVYGGPDDPNTDVFKAYPREVALSSSGEYLLVTSGYAIVALGLADLKNDYLFVYRVSDGTLIDTVALHDLSTPINAPIGLTVTDTDMLYLASANDDTLTSRIHRFQMNFSDPNSASGFSLGPQQTLSLTQPSREAGSFTASSDPNDPNHPNAIMLNWMLPTDPNLISVQIQRRGDTYPTSSTDGTTVYSGTATSTVDSDSSLISGSTYYYRLFAKYPSGLSGGIYASATLGVVSSSSSAPVATITDLAYDDVSDDLWVAGYTAPSFAEDDDPNGLFSSSADIFSEANLTRVRWPANAGPAAATSSTVELLSEDIAIIYAVEIVESVLGDVDYDETLDFGCITGPDNAMSPECVPLDFEPDTDVDMADVTTWQLNYPG